MGLVEGDIIRKKLINFLILAFLINGSLYFWFPQDIYNLNSPIRYLKYILIGLTLFLVFSKSKGVKIILYIFVSISLLAINIIALDSNFSLMSFLTYVIPLSLFFFYDGLSKYIKFKKIAIITYGIATIFSYVEFFVLEGHFMRFASSGYRVVSIFVNPNNFGLTIVVLTIFILGKINYQKNIYFSIAIFVNTTILVILTGSKTAMLTLSTALVLFFLYHCFKFISNKRLLNIKNLIVSLFGSSLLILLSSFFSTQLYKSMEYILKNSRDIGTALDSGAARLYQYQNFFNTASNNVIFPWRNFISYTDNIYLHIWGMFGLPILVLFISINIYLIAITLIRNMKLEAILLIVLLIAGLTTNVFYLWPHAYIYWYLVAHIFTSNYYELR